jgi:hypothetical protein
MSEHPAVAFLLAAHARSDDACRVAAEREILAEHADEWRCCSACSEEDYDGAERAFRRPLPWPCRTVLGLAKAWGWEAET